MPIVFAPKLFSERRKLPVLGEQGQKRAGQVRAYAAAAVLDRPNSAPVGGRLAGRLPRLEEELKLHVRHSPAHFMTPQWVTFVEELPKTATGKVHKFILRAGGAGIWRQ